MSRRVTTDVLWIGPWGANGLSSQSNASIAKAISSKGFTLATVIYGEEGSWKARGFQEVHYLPVQRTRTDVIRNQVRLVNLIAGFRGKVLVLGERATHLAAVARLVRAMLRRSWKIHIDVRTLPIPDQQNSLNVSRREDVRFWKSLRMGLIAADGWTAITTRLEQSVRERIEVPEIPMAIWESAVDAGFLTAGSEGASSSRTGEEVSFLYLGSLVAGRQIETAIEGVAKMRPRGRHTLQIVGDGPHKEALQEMVRTRGLEGIVTFHDPVPHSEVPRVIGACDAGVLPLPDCPAWNTSSPLKIFEYLAVGKPVIVTPIPAHVDLLEGQPFAFFMRDSSADGFCAAAESFAQLPAADRLKLSAQAKTFIGAEHTWDHRASVIQAFWQALLQSDGAASARPLQHPPRTGVLSE